MESEHPLTADDFRLALRRCFAAAKLGGGCAVEINSGRLHRSLGGYPGNQHRMPVCCEVMVSLMKDSDTILSQPAKGKGASLTIRYELPR